ncbi:cell wall hydrolase [Lachnospiraceae bacterium 62-35]
MRISIWKQKRILFMVYYAVVMAGLPAASVIYSTGTAAAAMEDKDGDSTYENTFLEVRDKEEQTLGGISYSAGGTVEYGQDNTSLMDWEARQEVQMLTGHFLEAGVRKRQERGELLKIQAEETKKGFLQRKEAENESIESSLSQEDYGVLLKIVEAEAGICDEKGRILVANVIMNRVANGQFPNSVQAVVYQPSQFSPVATGFINQVKVSDKTVECVRRALAGEDYSQGALYFMNREMSQKNAVRWFDGKLTYLFEHEGHEFFK